MGVGGGGGGASGVCLAKPLSVTFDPLHVVVEVGIRGGGVAVVAVGGAV